MRRHLSAVILSILFLGLIFSTQIAFAYTTIVQDYPLLPACENNAECRPGQTDFGLPQFVKYIFLFALGIAGVVGLIAIIMAAFGYVTSAGNPQKAADSKDKIISALLGLLLLLGSVVVLNIINPDLLKLKAEPVEEVNVDVTPPPPITKGCNLTDVSWDKGIINAGESARFIFTLSSECKDMALTWDIGDLWLLQVGGATSWRRDHCTCPEPQCSTIGLTSHYWICTFDKGPMINYYKDAAERFYFEGSLELNGVKQTLTKRLYITVRDLKPDGGCCL